MSMELLHKRDIIRLARDAWIKQYSTFAGSHQFPFQIKARRGETVADIRKRLAALDLETCSESDVDSAIGTTGWARLECDECGLSCDMLIHIGEVPDYDARWRDLCADCISEASKMLATAKPKP